MHNTVAGQDKGTKKAKNTIILPRKLSSDAKNMLLNIAAYNKHGNKISQRIVKRIALMRTVGFIHFSGYFLRDSKVFAPRSMFY